MHPSFRSRRFSAAGGWPTSRPNAFHWAPVDSWSPASRRISQWNAPRIKDNTACTKNPFRNWCCRSTGVPVVRDTSPQSHACFCSSICHHKQFLSTPQMSYFVVPCSRAVECGSRCCYRLPVRTCVRLSHYWSTPNCLVYRKCSAQHDRDMFLIFEAKFLQSRVRGSPQTRELNRGRLPLSKAIIWPIRRVSEETVRSR